MNLTESFSRLSKLTALFTADLKSLHADLSVAGMLTHLPDELFKILKEQIKTNRFSMTFKASSSELPNLYFFVDLLGNSFTQEDYPAIVSNTAQHYLRKQKVTVSLSYPNYDKTPIPDSPVLTAVLENNWGKIHQLLEDPIQHLPVLATCYRHNRRSLIKRVEGVVSAEVASSPLLLLAAASSSNIEVTRSFLPRASQSMKQHALTAAIAENDLQMVRMFHAHGIQSKSAVYHASTEVQAELLLASPGAATSSSALNFLLSAKDLSFSDLEKISARIRQHALSSASTTTTSAVSKMYIEIYSQQTDDLKVLALISSACNIHHEVRPEIAQQILKNPPATTEARRYLVQNFAEDLLIQGYKSKTAFLRKQALRCDSAVSTTALQYALTSGRLQDAAQMLNVSKKSSATDLYAELHKQNLSLKDFDSPSFVAKLMIESPEKVKKYHAERIENQRSSQHIACSLSKNSEVLQKFLQEVPEGISVRLLSDIIRRHDADALNVVFEASPTLCLNFIEEHGQIHAKDVVWCLEVLPKLHETQYECFASCLPWNFSPQSANIREELGQFGITSESQLAQNRLLQQILQNSPAATSEIVDLNSEMLESLVHLLFIIEDANTSEILSRLPQETSFSNFTALFERCLRSRSIENFAALARFQPEDCWKSLENTSLAMYGTFLMKEYGALFDEPPKCNNLNEKYIAAAIHAGIPPGVDHGRFIQHFLETPTFENPFEMLLDAGLDLNINIRKPNAKSGFRLSVVIDRLQKREPQNRCVKHFREVQHLTALSAILASPEFTPEERQRARTTPALLDAVNLGIVTKVDQLTGYLNASTPQHTRRI